MKLSKFRKHHKIIFAVVVATAVVMFWRGIWGLMDVLLLPDDYFLSSVISIILGLALLAVTHYKFRELA